MNFLPKGSKARDSWLTLSLRELSVRYKHADYAAKKDGYLLIKVYDKNYRRIIAGKWLLFSPDGTCLGHLLFFDEPTSALPKAWAEEKIADHEFLMDD